MGYLEETGRSEWSESIYRSGGLALGELEHSFSKFSKIVYIKTADQ